MKLFLLLAVLNAGIYVALGIPDLMPRRVKRQSTCPGGGTWVNINCTDNTVCVNMLGTGATCSQSQCCSPPQSQSTPAPGTQCAGTSLNIQCNSATECQSTNPSSYCCGGMCYVASQPQPAPGTQCAGTSLNIQCNSATECQSTNPSSYCCGGMCYVASQPQPAPGTQCTGTSLNTQCTSATQCQSINPSSYCCGGMCYIANQPQTNVCPNGGTSLNVPCQSTTTCSTSFGSWATCYNGVCCSEGNNNQNGSSNTQCINSGTYLGKSCSSYLDCLNLGTPAVCASTICCSYPNVNNNSNFGK